MHRFTRLSVLALLAAMLSAVPAATQPPATPELLSLSPALLARLPPDWRELATHIRASDDEQQRFLKMSEVAFRQNVARLLTRIRSADAFLRTQITADPSPAIRIALIQAITADTRWMATC
jgi:hypothetical protein